MAMVAALGNAVITRLIGAGIQRSGSLVFQKILRLGRIDAALKGLAKSPAVENAIRDFETIIGTYYAELNVETDAFLRELERSGLITVMVECALLKRDIQETAQLFDDLHKRMMPTKGSSTALHQRMMTSFQVSMEELCKDKILLEAIRLNRAELSERLDRVDAALGGLHRILRKEPGYNEDTKQTFLKIAKGLQSQYRSIRVETNKGPRSVEISRIYIPPKLTYRETLRGAEKIANILPLIGRIPRQNRSGNDLLEEQSDRDKVARLSYGDLRLSLSKVVVLGDPGGGKSTLCQHLCFDLAKQTLASLQLNDSKQINSQLQKFPVRVVLRSYEKARTLQPQLGLLDYILRDLRNYVAEDEGDLAAALRYLLSTGAILLAFDGLDEILVTARRREFVDLVKAFCEQFPLCPVLVTSRLVGYDDANLGDEFEEFVLERFDDPEVLSYATKFMKVVGNHKEKEAGRLANLFFKQTKSNASDLRRNPLLLGLMAWLFHMRGDVPSNRPEIYKECAILMFEKWDPDRDINADIPKGFDRLQLFSDLASKIFGHPELSAGVEAAWLERKIQAYFQRLYENKAQSIEASRALVKFITGRAWVMSEMGDGIFAFTHQTFLEYFFALHIDEMYDSVAEVFQKIMPRVAREEWDMVSHLCLQIKTYRNLRRQNESIDLLLKYLQASHTEKEAAAIASFSARSLEYLAASEGNIKSLVLALIDRSMSGADSSLFSRWQDVATCALGCVDRRDFIERLIAATLVDRFKAGDQEEMRRVSEVISPHGGFGGESSPSLTSILPPKLAENIRSELRAFVLERIEGSAFHAANAWQWFGVISRSLLAKHGIPVYFNASLAGVSVSVDGLTSLVLCASHHYCSLYHQHYGSALSRKKAEGALAAVGEVILSSRPIPRRMLYPSAGGPPYGLWLELISDLRPNAKAVVGATLAMLLAAERVDEAGDQRGAKQESDCSLEDVLSDVLKMDEVLKLKNIAQIRSAFNGKLLL